MTTRNGRAGVGCGTIVLLLFVCAAVAAYSLGAFDRLVYLFKVESNRATLIEPTAQVATNQPEYYVYAQLDNEDREKYLVLLDAFQTREPRTYPETTMDDLARMRDCVLADHPELFYVSGVQMRTETNRGSGFITGITVEGQYTYSQDEAAALQVQIDVAAAECLAGLPEEADDYAKAKYLYEYLAENIAYDRDAANGGLGVLGVSSGQTIADALVGHEALCAGYARSFQYLLREMGVPCVYVTGFARGEPHAWCVAFLDGSWYYVDPTWADPQFFDETGALADYDRINYDYLNVTDEDIATTHVNDSPYPLPTCTATADNYYVREDLYLYDANVDAAGTIITDAAARGDSSARFRYADRESYELATFLLFEAGEIYRFLPGNSCSYLLSPDLRTVEVVF